MSTLLRIKGAAALLLVASLALPQSTCSGYRGPDGKFVSELPRDSTRSAYQPAIQRQYALDDFHITDAGSWITLAAFVWPVAAVAILARGRGKRLRTSVAIAEPILAVSSAYIIWEFATILVTPAAGAYLAVGALTLYFATCVVELWRAVRNRRAAAAAPAAHVGSPS